jgi:hypothetical protein
MDASGGRASRAEHALRLVRMNSLGDIPRRSEKAVVNEGTLAKPTAFATS